MSLLGTHAWWLPATIGRRLPRVALEGRRSTGPATEGTRPATARKEETSA
jgi:hypothetical protein